jgi:hypothetical protein
MFASTSRTVATAAVAAAGMMATSNDTSFVSSVSAIRIGMENNVVEGNHNNGLTNNNNSGGVQQQVVLNQDNQDVKMDDVNELQGVNDKLGNLQLNENNQNNENQNENQQTAGEKKNGLIQKDGEKKDDKDLSDLKSAYNVSVGDIKASQIIEAKPEGIIEGNQEGGRGHKDANVIKHPNGMVERHPNSDSSEDGLIQKNNDGVPLIQKTNDQKNNGLIQNNGGLIQNNGAQFDRGTMEALSGGYKAIKELEKLNQESDDQEHKQKL